MVLRASAKGMQEDEREAWVIKERGEEGVGGRGAMMLPATE